MILDGNDFITSASLIQSSEIIFFWIISILVSKRSVPYNESNYLFSLFALYFLSEVIIDISLTGKEIIPEL